MARRRLSSSRRGHGCWDHIVAAPLRVAYTANLGTLLRTCDAVGACLAVPRTPHYRDALARGDTLPVRSCVHRVAPTREGWIAEQRSRGSRIVAVELAEDATPLPRVGAATGRTVVLLGHEHGGVPAEFCELADERITIPMTGRGVSGERRRRGLAGALPPGRAHVSPVAGPSGASGTMRPGLATSVPAGP